MILTKGREPIRHEREMSVTHTEFFRLLPRVVGEDYIQRNDSAAVIQTEIGRIDIRLGPEMRRKIALLELPMTEVSLEFHGYSQVDYEEFIRRFNLRFQKGGG